MITDKVGGNAIPLTAMERNIRYKLVSSDGKTRELKNNETYWLDGEEKTVIGKGTKLCTEDVIHYCDSPDLAVLYNSVHDDITNPRLIEIEIDKCVAHDGLKGGCKKARFVKEIPLPIWSIEEKLEYAIRIALTSHKEKDYSEWAENWLNGKDRTAESAARAAHASASAESATWASARVASASADAESAAWAAHASASASIRAASASASAEMFLQTSLKIIEKIKKGEHEMTDKEREFATKLTALLFEYGFGIADEPHIYELQYGIEGDGERKVSIDNNGRLQFV